MKRCLIITGGKLDLSFAGSFLGQETFDKIIAVDAGLEAVKALGLEPDMVVRYWHITGGWNILYGMPASRKRMRQTRSWPS